MANNLPLFPENKTGAFQSMQELECAIAHADRLDDRQQSDKSWKLLCSLIWHRMEVKSGKRKLSDRPD